MSKSLWCDKGEHSFSAKDPEKHHMNEEHEEPVFTGDSYGRPTFQQRTTVVEEIDICGPCWKSDNPFAPPKVVEAKAID